MRIAVTYENGNVFQHFGHTEQFKVYDVAEGKVINEEILEAGSSGHGALAGLLDGCKIDILICGGIGRGAQDALAEAGIKVYGGVTGETGKAVEDFLSGKLDYNPGIQCSHHEGHHHEGGCGENRNGCHGNGNCH